MARTLPDSIDWNAYVNDTDDGRADVRPASEFMDDVIRMFHGAEEVAGDPSPWSSLGDNLKFRSGEVTLWAGVNGHGKSGVLGYVVLDAMARGRRACIASLEMPMQATMTRMCAQSAGGASPSIDYITKFHRWTDARLWLYAHRGAATRDRMVAVTRYCRKELGIDHMVIDSLMKCGMAPDDYAAQTRFVDSLCVLARDTGVHIHLVHHIRKGDTEKSAPDKFDIKGAGEITDLVDNVLIVHRNKHKENSVQAARQLQDEAKRVSKLDELRRVPDVLLLCEKQRHFAWEGPTRLWFDKASQQLRDDPNASGRHLDLASGTWKQEWRR